MAETRQAVGSLYGRGSAMEAQENGKDIGLNILDIMRPLPTAGTVLLLVASQLRRRIRIKSASDNLVYFVCDPPVADHSQYSLADRSSHQGTRVRAKKVYA